VLLQQLMAQKQETANGGMMPMFDEEFLN